MTDKPVKISKLRERILDKQRLKVVQDPGKHHRIEKIDERKDLNRTPLMIALELAHDAPIEDLISEGTIYQVAKRLGIDPSTVSKWRTRLEL